MSEFCRIVVTTGPDRGKVFEPVEELVHIGRAAESHIVLDDPSVSEHQASLLRKNGRYAIFHPADSDVQVDGQTIPADQWVWLPSDVRVQFGRRTTCQFTCPEPVVADASTAARTSRSEARESGRGTVSEGRKSGTGAGQSVTVQAAVVRSGSAQKEAGPGKEPGAGQEAGAGRSGAGARAAGTGDSLDSIDGAAVARERDGGSGDGRRRRSRSAKPGRNVARFITDRGDPLVELGADGHLPELALAEGPARRERTKQARSSSPVVLYCVLGLSLLMTVALLLLDPEPASHSEISRSQAREQISQFFGSKDREPATWQRSLRAARLAYTRGDRVSELQAYRNVLAELNSEDRDRHVGLTGHLSTDRELQRLISVIISP